MERCLLYGGRTDINRVQKRPIHGRANDVCRVLTENNMSTIVAVMEGIEDVFRVIRHAVVMALHKQVLQRCAGVGGASEGDTGEYTISGRVEM